MSMEKKIMELFQATAKKYGGNLNATAEALGVNYVTFWSWMTGKRRFKSPLLDAIDKAGGSLVFKTPDGDTQLPTETQEELKRLRQEKAQSEKEALKWKKAFFDMKQDYLKSEQENVVLQQAMCALEAETYPSLPSSHIPEQLTV